MLNTAKVNSSLYSVVPEVWVYNYVWCTCMRTILFHCDCHHHREITTRAFISFKQLFTPATKQD